MSYLSYDPEYKKLQNINYAYEKYGLTLDQQKYVLNALEKHKSLKTAIKEALNFKAPLTVGGAVSMNKIINDLKKSLKVKPDIININSKQLSIITNILQILNKRKNKLLEMYSETSDPLRKIDISGNIEEIRGIMGKLLEMQENLLKINVHCKKCNIKGGLSYNAMRIKNDDPYIINDLATYYEENQLGGLSLSESINWVKNNPLKAASYGLGALALANILTNPAELDIM